MTCDASRFQSTVPANGFGQSHELKGYHSGCSRSLDSMQTACGMLLTIIATSTISDVYLYCSTLRPFAKITRRFSKPSGAPLVLQGNPLSVIYYFIHPFDVEKHLAYSLTDYTSRYISVKPFIRFLARRISMTSLASISPLVNSDPLRR